MQTRTIKSYIFPLLLLSSIILGGLCGYLFPTKVQILKPLGNIFINLIFTAIVPLILFSVAAAMARAAALKKVGKIMFSMILVFIFTGIIAGLYAIWVVKLFPPAQDILLPNIASIQNLQTATPPSLASIITVSNFSQLLSHEHILALILFAVLIGLATSKAGEKGRLFGQFLQAGEDIFIHVFNLIMYYAPIGFFAYFANLISELGPQLLAGYLRLTLIYYLCGLIYFVTAFSFFAYLAGGCQKIKRFWRHVFLPMITSLATCSSAASIPANLIATKAMGVPGEIYETTIPLGSIIHKDGSVIGGIFKIAFLFGVYHLPFSGASTLAIALGVGLLVGTVMGAIPSGGMLGELLILNLYGFPPQALMMMAAISLIIDPLATMLNVTGNSVSSMLITRLVEGKRSALTASQPDNIKI